MQKAAKRVGVLVSVVAVVLVVNACAATRERRGTPEEAGFLGDYSQLQKNEKYPAALVYVNPAAQWSRYNAIDLDSVTMWATKETSALSEEDKQMLTDTMYTQLYEQLDKYFVVTKSAGPTTLRLRAALTQAKGAHVALRVVTTVVPQIRLLGAVVGLAADTATMVGTATVEMEVLDSITDERLAAGVDERSGTKVLFAKRTFTTWGDVEAATEYWAKRVAWQLARHGVQRKPGVAMPEEPSQSRSF